VAEPRAALPEPRWELTLSWVEEDRRITRFATITPRHGDGFGLPLPEPDLVAAEARLQTLIIRGLRDGKVR
jgi:urease accessory protein UreE